MHRDNLRILLNAYQPEAIEERASKKDFLELLSNKVDCFERTCLEPGHITASSWLIDHTGTRALMHHHRKLNAWLQLGGHCDGDSDVLRVAIKEAQEESGILDIKPIFKEIFDLSIHFTPEYKNEAAHYHYDIRFFLQVQNDAPLVQSQESKALAWFCLDQAALPTQEPSIIRLFNKWKAYRRLS